MASKIYIQEDAARTVKEEKNESQVKQLKWKRYIRRNGRLLCETWWNGTENYNTVLLEEHRLGLGIN